MIYRIADPPVNGKGLIGVYPSWNEDGQNDAQILAGTRHFHFSMLFMRNHFAHFFSRIADQLKLYGSLIDIVCGWDVEKIKMFFLPINPHVEVFPFSAINFSLEPTIRTPGEKRSAKETDLFFAVSDRPDNLKQANLLVEILSQTKHRLRVVGYGRLTSQQLACIESNPNLDFNWYGKAAVNNPEQRVMFLTRLAKSRCLLVCSIAEGYSRLIGEALILGVPILLNARIQCENWIHLKANNCRLFLESTFEMALKDILSQHWDFHAPEFQPGNDYLKHLFVDFLTRRGLPVPDKWYTLEYGALNDLQMESM